MKELNVPVMPLTYSGEETTYIIYSEYMCNGEEFADDTEVITGHYIQIDLYSKNSYHNIAKKIKELLINVGFVRKEERELYENDTKLFHKVMRFFYAEN